MTEHFLICKRVDECENGKLCTMLRHDVGENVKLLGCSYFEPKKPMTNEEYLKTCTTEQLAEWIASVVQKAISIKESNGIVMLESAIWWDEWLKQLHSEVGK